ncbi:hypothetical protein [Kineococcus sp. SYSU DK005]|uniref:hypothetical protein n=1 Tax=Kineococcus sp. SYSU DK005 TaxID=3383126 RepID=UPI003D7C7352
MTVQPLPRATADAIADFVERRAARPRAGLSPEPGLTEREVGARVGWESFVHRYRQAVRDEHELTADNLAHALLDIAVLHRHHRDFQRGWLHWQEVLVALEQEQR